MKLFIILYRINPINPINPIIPINRCIISLHHIHITNFISCIIKYYCISSCDTGDGDVELFGAGDGAGDGGVVLCGAGDGALELCGAGDGGVVLFGSGDGYCLILNRRISSRQAARTTGSLINASIPIDGNRLASSLDIVY
jgi:hypothetical protein